MKGRRKVIDFGGEKSIAAFIIFMKWKSPFFFYLGFASRTFANHRTAREGGGYSIDSLLPFPPASQALRHWPGDCCRELTSAHSQQPDSNREPLVSGRKLLTTNLHTLDHGYMKYRSCTKWGKSDMQVGQIYLNQKEKKGHIKEAERCRGHM